MWNKHWSLKEGFTIGSGLVLTGLLLQVIIGPVIWQAFRWPANIIALGIFLVLLGVAYILKEKIPLIRFSLSYASAVSALCFAVILTIIMGVTRQSNSPADEDPLGLTCCLTNWAFVLIYLWIAWIVGFTAIHQFKCIVQSAKCKVQSAKCKVKNAHKTSESNDSNPTVHSALCTLHMKVCSLVSHLGLFIVLVCGTLGSADMQRLKMFCEYGKPEWRALDQNNKTIELPIAIQLDSFIMEEYPPKLTLVENKTLKAVEIGGKPFSVLLDDKFKCAEMGGWTVSVEKILDNAAPKMTIDTTVYVNWPVEGACCAVLVKAVKTNNQTTKQLNNQTTKRGWVTCGSYRLPSQMLNLDDKYSIGMPQREPKRYASKVQILSQEGDNIETVVEVNKPYDLRGWKIYQYSYNEQQGKWSSYSVFELVTDPWLPAVYTGIALIALGALGMFFSPSNVRRKEEDHVG